MKIDLRNGLIALVIGVFGEFCAVKMIRHPHNITKTNF